MMRDSVAGTSQDFPREVINLSEERPLIAHVGGRSDSTPLHQLRAEIHYELEFGVVVAGRLRRLCPDWDEVLEPGQIWLNGICEPHLWATVERPCHTVFFNIRPEMLAGLRFEEDIEFNWLAPFTVPPAERPQVPTHHRQNVRAQAETIMDMLPIKTGSQALLLRLRLLELLLLVQQEWSPPPTVAITSREHYYRISPALELALNSRRFVTTQEAAERCMMSYTHFGRMFKKVMGMTFATFALRLRLTGATAQLAHTSMPAKAIARRWGFADVSHLHRRFREQYGCTPHEYRLAHIV